MAERKFDIFEMIREIESTQIDFFDGLKDYEISQISPFILMKWMSGVKDRTQLIQINDTINHWVFSMSKHPKLMYKVLMSVATKKDKRVSWIKRPKLDKTSARLLIITQYYDCSFREADGYLKLLSQQDILDMGESLGIDKETANKLKKELNGK